MQTPVIKNKQKVIINYLFPFRFLHTHHLQTLLKHKYSKRTLSWLKKLIEKKYIKRHYKRNSIIANTKPAIYFLGPQTRKLLLLEKKLTEEEAEYIYHEHKIKNKFINHCLSIADVYLYLLSSKENDEELEFFTKLELRRYKYFPDPLPDAFIVIKSKNTTRRYFLDYFDPYTPSFVLKNRIKQYITYSEESDWAEQTDN